MTRLPSTLLRAIALGCVAAFISSASTQAATVIVSFEIPDYYVYDYATKQTTHVVLGQPAAGHVTFDDKIQGGVSPGYSDYSFYGPQDQYGPGPYGTRIYSPLASLFPGNAYSNLYGPRSGDYGFMSASYSAVSSQDYDTLFVVQSSSQTIESRSVNGNFSDYVIALRTFTQFPPKNDNGNGAIAFDTAAYFAYIQSVIAGGGHAVFEQDYYTYSLPDPYGLAVYSSGIAVTSNSVRLTNIAFAAVPEPSTWGMLLVGFGGIGFLLRQGRRRTIDVRPA